jgi:response regulator RpfG family c-di-GMP phosphodiesterase
MKILCVEHQSAETAILTYMLESIGYEILIANNREQAITLFKTQVIDGVLLEDNLPDATGSAVRARLKAIRPETPILLFRGVGRQTSSLMRFFDAYLRHREAFGGDLLPDM